MTQTTPGTTEYHKINAPYKRDKRGNMLHGEWSLAELEYLAFNPWNFTEKVDGTNIRLYFGRVEDYVDFSVGGRTDNAQIPKPLLERLFEICQFISDDVGRIMVNRDIDELIVYGEGYGPKINGGGRYGLSPEFVAFDVKVGDFWLRREDVEDFCRQTSLAVVPLLDVGTLYDGMYMVKKGLTSQWGDFEAEGVVATPTVPLFDRAGRRIITKIKARDFK